MVERVTYHVVPGKHGGWDVQQENTVRSLAIIHSGPGHSAGPDLAQSHEYSLLVVHDKNGQVEKQYNYGRLPAPAAGYAGRAPGGYMIYPDIGHVPPGRRRRRRTVETGIAGRRGRLAHREAGEELLQIGAAAFLAGGAAPVRLLSSTSITCPHFAHLYSKIGIELPLAKSIRGNTSAAASRILLWTSAFGSPRTTHAARLPARPTV